MLIIRKRAFLILIVLTTLLSAANMTWAQEETKPKLRLRNSTTAKGFIGGEAHESYVIRVRKGRTLTARISWKLVDDNRAEFTVSDSPGFYNGGQLPFGKWSENGRRWSGKVPTTGDYYIYVVAHPTAHYQLRVSVN